MYRTYCRRQAKTITWNPRSWTSSILSTRNRYRALSTSDQRKRQGRDNDTESTSTASSESVDTGKHDWVDKNFDTRYDKEKEFPTIASYVKKAQRYVNFNSDVQMNRALQRIFDVEARDLMRFRGNRILLYVLVAIIFALAVYSEWSNYTSGALTQDDVKELTGQTYRERKEVAQFGPQTEETFDEMAERLEKRAKGGGIVPPLVKHRTEKGESFAQNDFRTLTGDLGVLNSSYGKFFAFDVDPQRELFHKRMEAKKDWERVRLQRLKEQELANDPQERKRQEQMGPSERTPGWLR